MTQMYDQIAGQEAEDALLSLQSSIIYNQGSLLPLHLPRFVSVWLKFSFISRFWQEI